jgi:hypothetical protein
MPPISGAARRAQHFNDAQAIGAAGSRLLARETGVPSCMDRSSESNSDSFPGTQTWVAATALDAESEDVGARAGRYYLA